MKLTFVRKLWLFLFLAPIVVTFPILIYQQFVPVDPTLYAMHSRANGYQVLDQSSQVVGYVFGTMHGNFAEEELKVWKSTLETLLPSADYLCLEADMPHWSTLALGVERKALEAAEQFGYKNHKIEVISLEEISSQYALISCIKMAGPYRMVLPWGSFCDRHPYLVQNMNSWVAFSWAIPNLVYYSLINPKFVQELTQKNSADVAMMREHFIKGTTPVMDADKVMPFRIKERDAKMYHTIELLLKDRPLQKDHYFVACIGMLHLSCDQGILSQFEAHGYHLKPFAVVSLS